jgi:TonB-linked SusC/RagA family outer membrane protein
LSLQAYSNSYSQNKITLSEENASLEKIFQSIKQQSGYTFFYKDTWMAAARKVNIHVKEASINEVLNRCFENQPFTYSIIGKTVVIKPIISSALTIASLPPFPPITGKVTNEKGEPVTGAGIKVKGSSKGTVTNEKGEFQLDNLSADATLVISFIGYEPQEIKPAGKSYLQVQLKLSVSELDQVQTIAYGTTTKRLNTGDVSKITSEEIEKQPVSNVLAALEGRVPGLIITQANGLPGSTFKVQIRGQNSIAQGSDPLFVIDGVPFAPNNTPLTSIGSALGTGGASPFNSINMADIESVEVLKDADATSIYGSRGANGVVLITTKKGKVGKTQFNLNAYTGFSQITKGPNMMNTQQYLQMRHEAFTNDGVAPTVSTAPDLLLWDTTRYTDFKKLLIGGKAHTTDVQASVSGGTANTQFLIGGGYHHETTVFPGNLGDNRGSVHFNINHSSTDHKFELSLSAGYTSDKNNLIGKDITSSLTLVPDLPALFDSTSNLVWRLGGVRFNNPFGYLKQTYSDLTNNLISNLQLNYHMLPGLTLRTSLGYNTMESNELYLRPLSSTDPDLITTGISELGTGNARTWIVEPQVEYIKKINKGKLDVLIGGTWQEQTNAGSSITATGYTSDALLQSISAASSLNVTNSFSEYHYDAIFGRINYNWADKYIMNLSARRDGSSRFGPGKQFGNFGAIGAAWIFSNENFIKNSLPFLSFGKLRGSYGTAGNDQIRNYNYLDTWSATYYPYQGVAGLYPTQLFNPD